MLRRGSVLALVLGISWASMLPAAAAPGTPAAGRSQDASTLIDVSIDSFSPARPTAKDTLTVTGRITNSSTEVISDVEVGLRLSPTPLVGRDELAEVMAGRTDRIGERVAETLTRLDDSFTPGESKPFRLSVPVADLPLPQPGAYVTAVEALGTAQQPSNMLGLARTFLPWYPASASGTNQPLKLVLGWPLVAPPTRDAAGTFLNDEVVRSMASGGRLDRLLRTGATHRAAVSFMIDPDLIEAADEASRGYSVVSGDSTAEGSGAAAAESWVSLARASIGGSGQSALALPTALPDVVAWRRAKLTPYLRDTVTPPASMPAVLGRQIPGRTAITAVGNYPDRTIAALREIGFRALIASADAFPPNEQPGFTPTGRGQMATASGDMELLLYDEGLRAALDMPTNTEARASLAAQRLLADTLLASLEPAAAPRTLLALPGMIWNPSQAYLSSLMPALTSAPWLRRATLDDLREADPVPRVHADYTDAQRALETPADTMGTIARAEQTVTESDAVVKDGATAPASSTQPTIGDLRRGLLRSGSSLWATQRAQGEQLTARVSGQADARYDALRVVSAGSVLFSGSKGTIPITIENGLDVPANVGLSLVGEPPVRFSAESLEPFMIEPGIRTTREVSAEVIGGGDVTVTIQLTTAEGDPYGTPSTATVRSTAYSRAAAWVIGASFGVLVVLVLINGIRRRMSSRRGTPEDPGHEAREAELEQDLEEMDRGDR